MTSLAQLLRPSGSEVRELVLRETDPARAAEFEQLCLGPALTVLALFAIGVCAVVVTPFRIIRRLGSRR
jgi:hypothetical protein